MSLTSWVPGADGSGHPAEHLPYGVLAPPGQPPRAVVRIGDHALDLRRLAGDDVAGIGRLLPGAFDGPSLDGLLAAGPAAWAALRARLQEVVVDEGNRRAAAAALVDLAGAVPRLPFTVADYVDFYSSLEHATNLGRLFRPDAEPLLPNWRHLPVAYHGRAGTVVVSGTPVVRPAGQRRTPAGPVHGPTERLDIELEVGAVIGAPSTPGRPVPVDEAMAHVFGIVLVDDWSARDIQAWEYQPLGPFLGKSFATSVAAWVTPVAALGACRVPGPRQDPEPLPYLRRGEPWGLDLRLEVDLRPAGASAAQTISRVAASGLYWTIPQQIAHLTANGAHLRTGDLLASGTVSGPDPGSEGSLIELTHGGEVPLEVAGVARTFLEDGDEVVMRATAEGVDGTRIELGPVAGEVVAGPVVAPPGSTTG